MNVKRTFEEVEVFGDVKRGEAFSAPFGRATYVKTDIYMRPTGCVVGSDRIGSVEEFVPDQINAIDLSNGTGRYFRETESVVRHKNSVVVVYS